MSVLVVIPCLNEAKHLEGVMDGLLADSTVDTLVVADGGSDDGSQAIVRGAAQRDERVRLLNNPDRIQSAGINRTVGQYGDGHDWLLRVDAHCQYPEGYTGMLLRAAEERRADAVVVPMFTQGDSGFQLAVAAAQNSALGTGGSAHRSAKKGQYVEHGHHALIRMDLFQRVGGYCEVMACNEDAELDHRMAKVGGRIWLEPAATINYVPRATVRALTKQYFKYGKGRADTVKRHRLRPRLRQLLPLAVPPAILILPAAVWHWIFAIPFLSWLILCLGAGLVIGAKAGGGWRLFAGVAAAVMHAAWAFGFLRSYIFSKAAREPRYGLLSNP